LAKLIG